MFKERYGGDGLRCRRSSSKGAASRVVTSSEDLKMLVTQEWAFLNAQLTSVVVDRQLGLSLSVGVARINSCHEASRAIMTTLP